MAGPTCRSHRLQLGRSDEGRGASACPSPLRLRLFHPPRPEPPRAYPTTLTCWSPIVTCTAGSRNRRTCASALDRRQVAPPRPLHPPLVELVNSPPAPTTGCLKLARTIADLAAEEQIATAHVAKALQYRPRVAEGRSAARNTNPYQGVAEASELAIPAFLVRWRWRIGEPDGGIRDGSAAGSRTGRGQSPYA